MSSVSSVSLTHSVNQTASAHTVQAFIELVYVQTANNVMTSQMGSLESALSTTESTMSTLTQLQNLHNLVSVKAKGTFNPGFFSAGVTNPSVYRNAASAFFATPVSVSASFTGFSGGFAGFQSQMQTIVSQLKSEIAALSATTPLISGHVDQNSLYAKLQTVLQDITKTSAATNSAGAMKWIVDNYNAEGSAGVASSGMIQQDLTNAITAGQSLNTTQTESVRNFLYLFEEYYKSASAILSSLTQIIQKMADGISSS
jgi:hypothetical protein